MQKINLENQNLILTVDKICIALELINTSTHLLELNDKYTPYIVSARKLSNYLTIK